MMAQDRHTLARKILVPGIYLILMNGWVLFSFLLVYGFEGGIGEYNFNSFRLYFIAFGSTLITALIFQFVSRLILKWDQRELWAKYLFLCSAYGGNIFLIMSIYEYAARRGVRFGFFGGDPEGSFGMFLVPSAIIYFLVGGIITITFYLIHFIRHSSRNGFMNTFRGK